MSINTKLYNHLLEKFSKYSIDELIYLNNETINNKKWGFTRPTFRTALITTFRRLGIDLSHIIIKDDGYTYILSVPVRLENNSLIPLE